MTKPEPRQKHSTESFTLGLVLTGVGAVGLWSAFQDAVALPSVMGWTLDTDPAKTVLVGTIALGSGLLVLVRGPDLFAEPRRIDGIVFGATMALGAALMAWFAFAR
jgi:hypothetical protein